MKILNILNTLYTKKRCYFESSVCSSPISSIVQSVFCLWCYDPFQPSKRVMAIQNIPLNHRSIRLHYHKTLATGRLLSIGAQPATPRGRRSRLIGVIPPFPAKPRIFRGVPLMLRDCFPAGHHCSQEDPSGTQGT